MSAIQHKIYNDIIQEPSYDISFFTNFDEFLLFCEKDLSKLSGLQLLFFAPQIKFKQLIYEKFAEYHLTHDENGNKNKPITYFKYTYRKKI